MFLFFLRKKRLSCSYVLSILGKIALFKRKECFCSYFFKLRLEPFLILGNLRLSVLTELFLLEKKVLLKTLVYLHAPSND